MPIIYVRDMEESVAFYEALGFEPDAGIRSKMWTQLRAPGGAVLALHGVTDDAAAGRVELSMVAQEPLEEVAARAPLARGIADEAFGRSVVIRDPNGLEIQVNQHDT